MTTTATTTPPPMPYVAPDPFTTTPAERMALGEAARRRVPREALGQWEPDADRPDPVEILVEQGRHRVPELLPVRYGRMAVSSFTFLRGAPAIMAHDLSASPTTPLRTQLCGDAPVQLRVVRHAGTPVDLRPERLRRDTPRPLRVGRQAPVRQPARRGPLLRTG
jgi:hypothetical protein